MKFRCRDYRGKKAGEAPGQYYALVADEDEPAMKNAEGMMRHDIVFALLDPPPACDKDGGYGDAVPLPLLKVVDEMSDLVLVVPDAPPTPCESVNDLVLYHLRTAVVPWLKAKRDEVTRGEDKEPVFPTEPE